MCRLGGREYPSCYNTSMTTMTLHPTTTIPDNHLATAIPAAHGVWWLYGYRAHDLTARFTLIHDGAPIDGVDVIAHETPWSSMFRLLHERLKPAHVIPTMRCVLPPT